MNRTCSSSFLPPASDDENVSDVFRRRGVHDGTEKRTRTRTERRKARSEIQRNKKWKLTCCLARLFFPFKFFFFFFLFFYLFPSNQFGTTRYKRTALVLVHNHLYLPLLLPFLHFPCPFLQHPNPPTTLYLNSLFWLILRSS